MLSFFKGRLVQSLTSIKGLSDAKVDKICEAAEKLVVKKLCISFLVHIFYFLYNYNLLN